MCVTGFCHQRIADIGIVFRVILGTPYNNSKQDLARIIHVCTFKMLFDLRESIDLMMALILMHFFPYVCSFAKISTPTR